MNSTLAGGTEPWIVDRMRQIDEHVAAARREMEAIIRGRDIADLSEDEKKPLRALDAAVDHALEVKSQLERQRATPGATGSAPVEVLAKRADVQAAVGEYHAARADFEKAVAGGFGRMNHAQEQAVRQRLIRAEIVVEKFL